MGGILKLMLEKGPIRESAYLNKYKIEGPLWRVDIFKIMLVGS